MKDRNSRRTLHPDGMASRRQFLYPLGPSDDSSIATNDGTFRFIMDNSAENFNGVAIARRTKREGEYIEHALFANNTNET